MEALKKAYDARNLLQGTDRLDDKDKANQILDEQLAKIIKEAKDIPALVKELESIQAVNGGDLKSFAFPLFCHVFDVAVALQDGAKFQEMLRANKAELCDVLHRHVKNAWAVKQILEIKEYIWCKAEFDQFLRQARDANQDVKDMLKAAQVKCVLKTGKMINSRQQDYRWNMSAENLQCAVELESVMQRSGELI